MQRTISLFALAIVLALPVAAGQSAPQQPPAFRSAADVVEVDVVVHDKAGRFVSDLKAENFDVNEEGKPQKIELFYRVGSGAPSAAAPAVSAGAAPASPVAASRPPTPRVFIAVFDDDHLTPGGFKRVQAAALTLFEKHFQNGDIGGVLTRGQMTNKRLTSDREELLKAVKSARPSSKANSKLFDLREWPSMNDAEAFQISRRGLQNDDVLEEVVRRACADDPEACKRVPIEAAVYEKAQRMTNDIRLSSENALRTLAALLRGLETMNARKTLLLLSEGFVADESWPFVQEAVALAARANARIYSLDARGLDKGRQPIGNYAPHDDQLGNLLASFDIGADSTNSLAVDTGGFVVRNTNIFDQAIAGIVDDASSYYVLGYRPEALPDGKFHRISVKVNRPGITSRARRGYVATLRPVPATTKAAEPANTPAAAAVSDPGAAAPVPAALPAPDASSPATATAVSPAPAAAGSMIPSAMSSTSTMRLRPDASKHVEALAADAPDAAASAGWSAYQRGDVESARRSLAAAATSPSARPWVHYALGQASYALRQYQESVDEWEKVRSRAPEFEPVYFDLVDGYIQLRDPDKAIRVLRAAKSRWPNDAEVDNALGVVQVGRGALDDALQSFSHAMTVAPRESTAYFNLAKTLELRYVRTRRYVQQTRTWVANKADLENAIANYKRYLELGGPLEHSAREGLARLGWQSNP